MFEKLFGGPKTGTAKINGVVGQFESMITELETGAQMNSDKIMTNQGQILDLETENGDLNVVNSKADNVKNALLAIVNGG